MKSIFHTNEIPGGYHWTITSKLGHILYTAEQKYGLRDQEYTILGVELNENGPQVWYPGNRKHIIIQISNNCEHDISRAVFQTAHEVIHCLCPTGKNNSNVLEEGLANLFSLDYTREHGHGLTWQTMNQKYTDASHLLKELLAFDPDIIKKLRKIQPTISLINKALILKINPNVPAELAEKLTEKF